MEIQPFFIYPSIQSLPSLKLRNEKSFLPNRLSDTISKVTGHVFLGEIWAVSIQSGILFFMSVVITLSARSNNAHTPPIVKNHDPI